MASDLNEASDTRNEFGLTPAMMLSQYTTALKRAKAPETMLKRILGKHGNALDDKQKEYARQCCQDYYRGDIHLHDFIVRMESHGIPEEITTDIWIKLDRQSVNGLDKDERKHITFQDFLECWDLPQEK